MRQVMQWSWRNTTSGTYDTLEGGDGDSEYALYSDTARALEGKRSTSRSGLMATNNMQLLQLPMSFWFLRFYTEPGVEQEYQTERLAVLAGNMSFYLALIVVFLGSWAIMGCVDFSTGEVTMAPYFSTTGWSMFTSAAGVLYLVLLRCCGLRRSRFLFDTMTVFVLFACCFFVYFVVHPDNTIADPANLPANATVSPELLYGV
jgi:hypothetical protein